MLPLWIQHYTIITFIKGNRLLLGGKTEAPAVEQKTGQLNAAEDKIGGYGKAMSGDIHADYARTVAEIQKLREEESQLRMENIELKVGVWTAVKIAPVQFFRFCPNIFFSIIFWNLFPSFFVLKTDV